MNPTNRVHIVFPRRKQHANGLGAPVELTLEFLKPFFTKPLAQVCDDLGISATAIKKACRRFGIPKWPFRTLTSKTSRNRSKVMEWEINDGPPSLHRSHPTPQLPATRALDSSADFSTKIKVESSQQCLHPAWLDSSADFSTKIKVESSQYCLHPAWIGDASHTPNSESDTASDSTSNSHDEDDETEHVSSPLLEAPGEFHGIVHKAPLVECNGNWEQAHVPVDSWGFPSPFHFPEDCPFEGCESDLWTLNIG